MRPIKLTMSAFGPYGDIEVIDFDLFADQSIFVITGKTGSGKTTIFDGISYALYGMASGSDRDGESFRSDFNKEDRLTYVELEFLLRGEKYFIRRVPKQIRPVKIGEGYTEQKPEAELKLPGGKVIWGIDKVNEAVAALMGINYNQFRQIVMIPQGEFREFLLADSKNREAIFRKIFGTYQFQGIQDSLERKSKDLKVKLVKLEDNQRLYAKSIDSGEDEGLKEMIDGEYLNIIGITEGLNIFIEKEIEKEESFLKSIKKHGTELDKLNMELTKGLETNNRFTEEEESKSLLASLKEKAAEFQEKEDLLKRGRKALTIKASENNCFLRHSSMRTKEKEKEEGIKALDGAIKREAQAREAFIETENKELQRQELMESLAVLKKDKGKVIEFSNKTIELRETGSQFKDNEDKRNKLKESITVLKAKEEKLIKDMEQCQKGELLYVSTKAELDKHEEIYNKLDKIKKELEELKGIRDKHGKGKEEFQKHETEYLNIKKEYERLNDLFLKGQAGILAQGLKDGCSCPVCGSPEHPNPALITHGTPTEEELNNKKEEFTIKDEERKKLFNRLTELKAKESSQLAMLKKLMEDLNYDDIPDVASPLVIDFINRKKNEETVEIKRLKTIVAELDKQKSMINKIKEALVEIKEGLEKEEETFEKVKQKAVALSTKGEALKEQLERMVKELPEGITTIEAMEKLVKLKEEELLKLEEERKKAEKAYKDAQMQLTAAETTNKENEKAYKAAKIEYSDSLKKLDEDILEAGFLDRADYKASRMEESNIIKLEKETKEYYGELKSAGDRHDKAVKAIVDLKLVNIEEIENKIKVIKAEKESYEEQNKKVYARLVKNKELQRNMESIKKLIDKEDAEYRKISYLAELAKGNNSEKLSFERYVLAAYFDDIIKAANIRLKRMTDGRFELSRIQEKQKGKAQQGLDLEVFDYYTGKPRHVKVISGGESFKASLSLALGLSDVVQSSSGGISIDTMFIDEGFGTLDSESLEKSIECLLELQQSGKFVGVISHVPELKERIRDRIEINSSITGSSAKIVVG